MKTPLEPQPGLGKAIGIDHLWFKREDLHPYGSHKGRSIPVMIDYYRERGDKRFAITGSGNAALAAALHVQKLNRGETISPEEGLHSLRMGTIDLDIYLGQHAAPHKAKKLKELANDTIHVLTKERPLQALTQAVNDGARSLRQSTDDVALLGYKELAEELALAKHVGAIFMGTSSGTTAQALAHFFATSPTHKGQKKIQIHIVQTSSCHPFVDVFETYDGPEETSHADAIIDKTAVRKDALIPLIQETGGYGWFATNDEIATAQALVRDHAGLSISANSALSIVGAMQAAYRGWEFNGAVICMICGD